ncbi:chaperone modulator CbpM [Desulfonatronum lacustre]|uniref:chaperone modulator CbpM n=1 Tax=Desulfonatronum lacustre TaxID=66849 RepID=UPI0004906123|nr:chaperone modulator CbpM [Desulfonatronum lacustre]SMP43443.1 chaperone modulatory protein CbpM [Desulfonatronum zhilinae]
MALSIKILNEELPATSELVIWSRFIELTGIHPTRLGELVELGWLCPNRTQEDCYLFHPRDVYKVSKLERICTDFELPALAGTIIIDLLERIEDLELQVRDLRRLL